MHKEVRPGQIWKDDSHGESWIVTKVYSEAFDSYASIRKVNGDEEETRRLRIVKSADGPTLPGFKLIMA
jgi:hypothetical protein